MFVFSLKVRSQNFSVNLHGLCLDQDRNPANPIISPVLPPMVGASLNYYIARPNFLLAAIFKNMNRST
ncbi:hypothetical protein AG1IA_04115 [Rhizoctonia solani AG-1 IA]|uniref:Uncharacterized protein n=1 Tax=Thanatephorus cucumeris (strain AG1-IA) TaxID=983506 RepID=L8WZS7_THACA|nr:hypothetical protein AG1IA_04115 [Rhizoctonia solani AG-1 IA]